MSIGLLTGLATIAQGEKQITIVASLSAAYVGSGTLILIAGEAVEVVSGTANTITLKDNWEGDSQTNTRFTVINTREGIRDIIGTAKQVSENYVNLLSDHNLLLSSENPEVTIEINGTPKTFVPVAYLTNKVGDLVNGATTAVDAFDALSSDVDTLSGGVTALQETTTNIDNTMQGYVDSTSTDATKAKEYAVQPYGVPVTNTSDNSSLHHAADANNSKVIAVQAKSDTAALKSEVETFKNLTDAIHDKAYKLSTFGEDQEIEPGVFGLKHYAIKAQAAAALAQSVVASVTANIYFVGGWDASSNTAPPPPSINAGTPVYKITVAGVIDGVTFDPNDNILFDPQNSSHDGVNWTLEKWMKIDNTENVSSVNGKAGAVMLTSADIPGLDASLNTIQNNIDAKVTTDDLNAQVAELETLISANTLNTTIKMWGFTV